MQNMFGFKIGKNNGFDITIPFISINSGGDIKKTNEAFKEYKNLIGKNLFQNLSENKKEAFKDAFFDNNEAVFYDLEFKEEEKNYFFRFFKGGKPTEDTYGLFFVDISKINELEAQIIQSQKMQAVGQLAGGIAHDFNNILTAIIGFCDLLLSRVTPSDPSFADLMQIKQNSNRAAWLVGQLLAFSRKQTMQPKVINITDEIAEVSNLIRRLIGANINLNISYAKDLWDIKVDKVQLEQVLINLAVNARDAMQQIGGELIIRTSNLSIKSPKDIPKLFPQDTYFPEDDASVQNGEYVLMEVIDNGTGIEKSVAEKVFEPFFTTKDVGKGTGLGLSTVYGIIKQTGGYIYFSSKPDNIKKQEKGGTAFYILFKRYKREDEEIVFEIEPTKQETRDLTGSGTVLIVEDEPSVRMFAHRALGNKGYKILEADSGNQGYEIIKARGGKIDLIITDVVMPGVTGPSMIEKVLSEYPKIKVIFISGYGEDVFLKSFGNKRDFNFLAKPFSLKDLVNKVKEVLSH
jgi:two-component system cell cycle sensor histidine kinase/response regulator CckA